MHRVISFARVPSGPRAIPSTPNWKVPMASCRAPAALLAALSLLLGTATALAHDVAADGSAAEWFATPTAQSDLGRIALRPDGGGEYAWHDAAGDARGAWPARPCDLLELRVTGDHTRLYVLAVLATPVATAGDSVPQLQLALDLDHFTGSGGWAFVDSAETAVGAVGAYEWLVQTRFGSAQAPRLLDGWGNPHASGAQATLSAAGVLELAVPWSDLGIQFVPENPVRFTAALFLTRADDFAIDPRDGTPSRAADVVSQCNGPGLGGPTLGEVADGSADYSFDVWFGLRGEPMAPVVVSEGSFDGGSNAQWIELANASRGVVPSGWFKVGDQETPGSNEGMATLPSGTLLVPGETFVVARNGAAFLADWGLHADAECESSDAATPDMAAFAPWAGNASFHVPASGDQLLVLDRANTIVDVLVFGNASYPGIVPRASVPLRHTLERPDPGEDTDDCVADFVDQAAPTPFAAPPIVTAAGPQPAARSLAWLPPRPNPVRDRVTLSLRFARPGRATVDVFDAAGRLVRRLLEAEAVPGEMQLGWDARNANGRDVPPGLYFVRAEAGAERALLRLAVVR